MTGVADSIDWVLLTRFFNHSCTAEERRAVQAWVERDPANAAALDDARAVWEATGALPESWNVAAGWRAIETKLDAIDRVGAAPGRQSDAVPAGAVVATIGEHRRADVWRSRAPIGAIAAAVLVALGVGLVVGSHRSAPLPTAGREYATAPGQRETVTLGDGTEFTLAPASRLRLAADYGASRRELTLEGEAYFAVVHDGARPFVVHTANAVTEDIGTRFAVRAYPEDRGVQVVVAEGAVSLGDTASASGSRSVLTHGMLGRVGGDGTTSVVRGVDIDAYVGWTRGALVFQATPVREAVTELSRWYGLDIQLGDSTLARGAITASFKDEALDDVLRSVATAIGGTVERQGHRVVFVRGAHGGHS